MKKYLIFLVLILSHFSIHAEGVKLSCLPTEPVCANCQEYQTLFPIEEFSTDTDSLDIEADQSELIEGKYLLNGNVEVNSEKLYLAADDVEVSSIDNSLLAAGNVKFQDQAFLITGDALAASRDEDENLIATATNANYQDFAAGIGGANGYAESISKTSNRVLLSNTTYSLCPVNKNDWLIDADQIVLNLDKNRGVADHAIVKFYGVPIFYLPKYSWVLSGRGSGFLTPNYSTYTDVEAENVTTLIDARGKTISSYSYRIPYYFNIAPDRDLLIALNYMSSRGYIYEGKYRQLIAPKLTPERDISFFELEGKYARADDITSLKRWLVKFNGELDISKETHLSAQYYRVSDEKYFAEIARTNTNLATLQSFLKLTYADEEISTGILTENEQVVNAGTPGYTRLLEGYLSKPFIIDTYKVEKIDAQNNAEIERQLYEQAKGTRRWDSRESVEDEKIAEKIYNQSKFKDWKYPNISISTDFVSTKFHHKNHLKESGVRTNGNIGISRPLAIKFPSITPSASVGITNYALKNSPNINRTIFGSGLTIDFTTSRQRSLFGKESNHQISPIITYNYRAKKVQGNIPIFDTVDKYADIITFADLTSGERYTGLDRITNANDITVSLESSNRDINALPEDKDLLNLRIAQSFYTDDEVVSDTANTNFETRKSYSDIAASIDLAVNNFVITTSAQFNPDTSKIVKRENSISYEPSSRKFATIKYSDDSTLRTGEIYTSYPLSKSIHIFGGLDRTITKATGVGIINSYATGFAYENCCWAFRVAHFQDDKQQGNGSHNYSTGMELVLTGLGSSSTPLKGKIEYNILGYTANLRE